MWVDVGVLIQNWISWFAVASSLVVYAAGSKTCFQIIKRKTVGDVALAPFVASLYNGVIMLKYGLLSHVMSLIIVATVNTTCQILYIIIYYGYSQNKRKCHRLLGISLPILYSILIYSKYLSASESNAIIMLGVLGAASGILMSASPLVSLADVIEKKSTNSLDFGFISANFISCCLWTITGFLLKDIVVIAPNACGILLTTFQLWLFVYYPTKSSSLLYADKEKLSDQDLSIESEP